MAKKRFIFDENYINRYAKKDKTKWLIIGACGLILILIIIIIILANRKTSRKVSPVVPSFELKDEIVIQSGDPLPEVVDYFKKLENIDLDSIEVIYPFSFEISYDTSNCSEEDLEQINENKNFLDYDCVTQILKTPETYGVTLNVLDKEYTVKLTVEDSNPPVIVTKDVEIYVGDSYQIDDFIDFCLDSSGECQTSYYEEDVDDDGNKIDYSAFTEPGVHTVKIIATDDYGNTSEPVEAELNIVRTSTLYSVSFDANGGTEVEGILVQSGLTAKEPTTSRDGYNFLGWYNGEDKFDFNTPITSDIKLTARWEEIPSNPGGGNQSGGGSSGGGTTPKPETPSVINVTSVSLNYTKINLYVGDSKTVSATVYPSNATNKSVSWSSSNNGIATVDNGKITGVASGTTTITATSGGKSATVTVVVVDKYTSGGTTCTYGDTNYNTSYILSVNVTKNNCAVDPNRDYNEATSVAVTDYNKLVSNINSMGLSTGNSYFSYSADYYKVKNTMGNGLVGYQITIYVKAIDPVNPTNYMTSTYIIKPDGSRQFLSNNITKNGNKLPS